MPSWIPLKAIWLLCKERNTGWIFRITVCEYLDMIWLDLIILTITREEVLRNADSMTDSSDLKTQIQYPVLVVEIGDLNAAPSSWCINDNSYSVWSQTGHQRTQPFAWEFFLYLLNIYFSTNFSDGCRRPSVLTPKLSSSSCLCQI